jgi:hypothetical protein
MGSPVMPLRFVTPSREARDKHSTLVMRGQTNADTFVKAMTDGEMNARDMVYSLINHITLATSEDLRWGMLWPDLVSSRWSR